MLLKMTLGRLSLIDKKQGAEKYRDTESEADQSVFSILPMASTVGSTANTPRFQVFL